MDDLTGLLALSATTVVIGAIGTWAGLLSLLGTPTPPPPLRTGVNPHNAWRRGVQRGRT